MTGPIRRWHNNLSPLRRSLDAFPFRPAIPSHPIRGGGGGGGPALCTADNSTRTGVFFFRCLKALSNESSRVEGLPTVPTKVVHPTTGSSPHRLLTCS